LVLPIAGIDHRWYCPSLVLLIVGIAHCVVLLAVGIAHRWYYPSLVLPIVGIGHRWYCTSRWYCPLLWYCASVVLPVIAGIAHRVGKLFIGGTAHRWYCPSR
jgi:hypothetical protein